eukprot:COSAG05_NODE_8462_length_701_cov_20980.631229_1_plen_25_part_10
MPKQRGYKGGHVGRGAQSRGFARRR